MSKCPKLSIRSLAGALAFAPVRIDAAMRAAMRAAASRCQAKARQFDARQAASWALAAATLALVADPVLAQATGGGGDITTFLQNLVNIITGTAGKLIAVLAICVCGVMALIGGMSMRTAGGVVMGVLLIFSSAWLVDQIVA